MRWKRCDDGPVRKQKYDCMSFRLPNTIAIIGNSSRCPRVYAFSITYFLVSHLHTTNNAAQNKNNNNHTHTHSLLLNAKNSFLQCAAVFSGCLFASVCMNVIRVSLVCVCVRARCRICREQNGVSLMHSGPSNTMKVFRFRQSIWFSCAWKAAE